MAHAPDWLQFAAKEIGSGAGDGHPALVHLKIDADTGESFGKIGAGGRTRTDTED